MYVPVSVCVPKVAEVDAPPVNPPETAIPFGLASIEPMKWSPVPPDAFAHCQAPEPSILVMNALLDEAAEVTECEPKDAVPWNKPPTYESVPSVSKPQGMITPLGAPAV